jgi:membrane protease YdiL (CAAX protease family)
VRGIRLFFWFVVVGGVAAINYAAYGHSTSSSHSDDIYSYAAFTDGVVFYALVLGATLLIAIDRRDLLALRRPRIPLAVKLGLGAIVGILVLEYAVTALPVEDPGKEQGLTPTHWEPSHAGAFAANVVLFCAIAPFVEELLFRGVGYSLVRSSLGAAPAIAIVGVMFGAWHGLLVALLILIPFGAVLAFVRERTDSVVPGMVVHALFNGAAIAVSVLSS